MANSFSSLFVHLVYSTKSRIPSLADGVRPDLHAYLGGITKKAGSVPIIFNSVPDHLHGLVSLKRDENVANLIMRLKKASNLFLREYFPEIIPESFSWQSGYGAFSVSYSAVPDVEQYIANQEIHHTGFGFVDEIRALVKKNNIQIDEKYIFD